MAADLFARQVGREQYGDLVGCRPRLDSVHEIRELAGVQIRQSRRELRTLEVHGRPGHRGCSVPLTAVGRKVQVTELQAIDREPLKETLHFFQMRRVQGGHGAGDGDPRPALAELPLCVQRRFQDVERPGKTALRSADGIVNVADAVERHRHRVESGADQRTVRLFVPSRVGRQVQRDPFLLHGLCQ